MLYAVIKGMPIKHTVRYETVPETASSGVDMTDTIPRTEKRRIPVRTSDKTINSVTVLPMA